jgi:hypothetical protein
MMIGKHSYGRAHCSPSLGLSVHCGKTALQLQWPKGQQAKCLHVLSTFGHEWWLIDRPLPALPPSKDTPFLLCAAVLSCFCFVLSLQQLSDRPCSFNGQEGSDGKQRRWLEMEVLSQRTRAVAAERALADVAQDYRRLQQDVMALEVRA